MSVILSVFQPVVKRVMRLGFLVGEAEVISGLPDKVSATTPSDGAVNQQIDLTITWARPSQAQTYDVYFGTVSESLTLVSEDQLARSYVPEGLELDGTYYFRIDSKNTYGTTAGDEVSFSTWSADDIWTDQDGNPWTDGEGNYIELGVEA